MLLLEQRGTDFIRCARMAVLAQMLQAVTFGPGDARTGQERAGHTCHGQGLLPLRGSPMIGGHGTDSR